MSGLTGCPTLTPGYRQTRHWRQALWRSKNLTPVKLRGAIAPAGLEGYAISLEEAERGSFLPLALELWHRRDAVRKQLARLHREAQAWEAERWRGICRSLNLGANAEPSPTSPHLFVWSAPATIAEQQWHRYDRDGYLRLGSLLDQQELTMLRERIDAIMLGRIRYPRL